LTQDFATSGLLIEMHESLILVSALQDARKYRNEKVEQYIRTKTHKLNVLKILG